jgi:uncharacterized protein YutE (UPF0331/DUF86 family)
MAKKITASKEVFAENLEQFKSSIDWLRRSYAQCAPIGVKKFYSDDEYDDLENLTSRYARAVDLLVHKLFRSLDAVELMPPGSLIDSANRAVKRGFVDSTDTLRTLKDLRNEIAHEYAPDDLSDLFGAVLAATGTLFQIAEKCLAYCDKHFFPRKSAAQRIFSHEKM